MNASEHISCFREWQEKNRYAGKRFSILGDSISTLAGYNPRGYSIFYTGDTCAKAGVAEMTDTWWGKIIDFFGGELLMNNSWSGSRVTKLPAQDELFPSGCSDERTSALHMNTIMPDVIIVYLGINDWAYGAAEYSDDYDGESILKTEGFRFAYTSMIGKIKTNYPKAEIWCCTLNTTYISQNPSFRFPYVYAERHIEEYNEMIKDIVSRQNCNLIDLYSYHMPYDSIDGSHPNANGMNTLARLIIRELGGLETALFLDCENEKHEYMLAAEDAEGKHYVCQNCGKKILQKWSEAVTGKLDEFASYGDFFIS